LDEKESFIPNLENSEIITFNEKLKHLDYDLRYKTKEFSIFEKNPNNLSHPKHVDEIKEGETVSINFNFKPKKEEAKNKIKKPLFFDD
jgi:hypothetical protein